MITKTIRPTDNKTTRGRKYQNEAVFYCLLLICFVLCVVTLVESDPLDDKICPEGKLTTPLSLYLAPMNNAQIAWLSLSLGVVCEILSHSNTYVLRMSSMLLLHVPDVLTRRRGNLLCLQKLWICFVAVRFDYLVVTSKHKFFYVFLGCILMLVTCTVAF